MNEQVLCVSAAAVIQGSIPRTNAVRQPEHGCMTLRFLVWFCFPFCDNYYGFFFNIHCIALV